MIVVFFPFLGSFRHFRSPVFFTLCVHPSPPSLTRHISLQYLQHQHLPAFLPLLSPVVLPIPPPFPVSFSDLPRRYRQLCNQPLVSTDSPRLVEG